MEAILRACIDPRFGYHRTMDAEPDADDGPIAQAAAISATIAEPARARMLAALMDGRHRTATELGLVARIAPSTASAHLARLVDSGLVRCAAQGRYRYFRLAGRDVAATLEALFGLAGATSQQLRVRTPPRLRYARTCYDHLAGELGVVLHDRMLALGWMKATKKRTAYELMPDGHAGLGAWGVDVESARLRRRQFAVPCLDWSERRPHLAGSLAAAVLERWLNRKWIVRELDGRAVELTPRGSQALRPLLGATPGKP
jgi:DNA-binding transcriptional ArsR family regulator